jgi:hypothetical protein
MSEFKEVKDSGKRQEFSTGSVRDTDVGKGSPHLIATEVFLKVKEYKNSSDYPVSDPDESLLSQIETLLWRYNKLVYTREEQDLILFQAIDLSCLAIAEDEGTYKYTDAYRRLAVHYFNGAKKYQKNNWRRGQYVSRYYDSAMRHLWAAQDGDRTEDHKGALLWNLVAIVQTKIDVEKKLLPQELDDFPFTITETIKQKNMQVIKLTDRKEI